MARLAWYWHRLRAMDRAEIGGRVRKALLQASDARLNRDWTSVPLKPGQAYPHFPDPNDAPEALRAALRREVEEILAGKWRAFGHLPIRVSDPPDWHRDYLAGISLPTEESAFRLNYRELPNGADVKLIWELSRWHPLTRLALAAHLCEDDRAAWKCVHWLEHWVQHNPPYRGWNWTSALESGMRLIQFTWIDELLRRFVARGECESELEQLRYDILPAHVWYTWRHKSFGSSANNHLLGELAGLIVATVRWPELSAWGASLEALQATWEREVMAQFAADGGNREQALNYHLFSFELCWHARNALRAAGRSISSAVEERFAAAIGFFIAVQAPNDAWDYGDSDTAFVLPLPVHLDEPAREWLEWMQGKPGAVSYFAGAAPKLVTKAETVADGWQVFRESGLAVYRSGKLFLRWDVSPLGYLSTAAHGHMDALHLSVWIDDTAMIIDPGTGAYYADRELRSWLASRQAHNGPAPAGEEWPRRVGPFLWSEHHAKPALEAMKRGVAAELQMPAAVLSRSIRVSETGEIVVEDSMRPLTAITSFTVLWQFAPEATCQRIDARRFSVRRGAATMEIAASEDWDSLDLVDARPQSDARIQGGSVSRQFRAIEWAPHLKLMARPHRSGTCIFETILRTFNH